MKRIMEICVVFIAGLLSISATCAQSYPDRAVRMVVAYSAGGANDLLARVVSQKLSEIWGQPVIVENKPGANAIIGTDLVRQSPPDGYTLLMGATGSHTINPVLYNKLPYNPVEDFEPVSLVASSPLVIAVNPKVPVRSVQELIALAKAEPNALNYGAGASLFNLAAELFKSRTGTDITYIPYKGSAPAVTDVLSGQLQVLVDAIAAPLPHIQQGTLRALAVTSAKRSSKLPDVPTLSESGVPGYEVGAWSGIYAPAGTPKAILTKIETDVRQALADPEVRKRIMQVGYEPSGMGPAGFAALMDREIKEYSKVVVDANIPKLN